MKKKGALLVSISLVLVAVLALTTASFAWFSSSMNPTIGDFDVTVTTSNALLISAKKDADFKTVLDFADLQDVADNVLPGKADAKKPALNAATPAIVTNSGNAAQTGKAQISNIGTDPVLPGLEFMVAKEGSKFDGNYAAGGEGNDYTAVDKATGVMAGETDTVRFMKFDVYFKSTMASGNGVKVKLDITSKGDLDAYIGTSFTAKDPKANTNQQHIAKLIRVAFVSYDVTAALTNQNITDANAGTAGPISFKVYEADNRTVDGLSNTVTYDKRAQYVPDAKNNIEIDNTLTAADNLELFEVDNTKVIKTSVYIWLEGNDAECESTVSGGVFTSMFKFVGEEIIPAP